MTQQTDAIEPDFICYKQMFIRRTEGGLWEVTVDHDGPPIIPHGYSSIEAAKWAINQWLRNR